MESREAIHIRLVSIVVLFILMLGLSNGSAIRSQEGTSTREVTSPSNVVQQKSEVFTGAPVKMITSHKESWSNNGRVELTNCGEVGGNNMPGYLCDEQASQKTTGTAENTTRAGNDRRKTKEETNKTATNQAVRGKNTVTTEANVYSQETLQTAQDVNDTVTQTMQVMQGMSATLQTTAGRTNETIEPFSQTEGTLQGKNKTVTKINTPMTEPVNETNESVDQGEKAVQGTTETRQTTTTTTTTTTRQMTMESNTTAQATIRSTASLLYATDTAGLRDKTANSTQTLTTATTGERVTTTRPAYANTVTLAELPSMTTTPEKTTSDQNLPNSRESTPVNQHGTARTTATQSDEGTRQRIAAEEKTTASQEDIIDSHVNEETRGRNHGVLKPANVRLYGLEETVRSTSPQTVAERKEKLVKDATSGGTRRVIFDQRYVILDAQQRMIIRGQSSSSVHGLIWDINTDTQYVKDVLVPIGCGITGALLIVIVAYLWRNYWCRQKCTQHTPAVGAKKQKKDHVMLLGDSSDEDDAGIPVWQFD